MLEQFLDSLFLLQGESFYSFGFLRPVFSEPRISS